MRARWRFTSEHERVIDASSSFRQRNFHRLWSSIFPTRESPRENWLCVFCAHMPSSTACNFDRVFGPLWTVSTERETMLREMEKIHWSQLLRSRRSDAFCPLAILLFRSQRKTLRMLSSYIWLSKVIFYYFTKDNTHIYIYNN